MLKRLSCSALLFLSLTGLSFISTAQEIAAGFNLGYATFNMEELKVIQRELSGQYPFDAKVVESFPGYLNFSD
jgi:Skp family chaperone for outer membrane proteins